MILLSSSVHFKAWRSALQNAKPLSSLLLGSSWACGPTCCGPSCAQMSSRVRRCAVQEPTVGFWIPKVRECMWKAIVSILSSECPPPWWHYLQEAVATPPASSSCPKCKCLAARLLQRIVKVAKRCAGRTLQTCSYSSAWMCLCASGKVRIKIGDLGWAESLGFILSWWIWWESIPEQSTMSTSAQILDQLGCDEHCWLLLCEGQAKELQWGWAGFRTNMMVIGFARFFASWSYFASDITSSQRLQA